MGANLADALGVGGRRNRTFDQRHVEWPTFNMARGFKEVRDPQLAGHGQQFIFAIEKRKLAAIARSKFEYGQTRLH